MTTIRDLPTYKIAITEHDAKLRAYSVTARGRRRMSSGVFSDLTDRQRGNLLSASASARIAVAEATSEALNEKLDITRSRKAFFVTLTPKMGVRFKNDTPLDYFTPSGRWKRKGGGRPIRGAWGEIKAWAARMFAGMTYIGIIEVSYYTAHPWVQEHGPLFCFHAHLIVWDAPKERIEAIRDRINAEHQAAVLPGVKAAHIAALNSTPRVVGSILYGLKPPLKEYRAFKKQSVEGEPEWKQPKRALRPGDACVVANVLAGVQIDELMFDGGDAAGLTNQIATNARRALRRQERRQRAELQRLESEAA